MAEGLHIANPQSVDSRKPQQGGKDLYISLRRKHRKYNRRPKKDAGRRLIKNPTCISERPVAVALRLTFGHWEADTVIGTSRRGKVLVTLVERTSRCPVAGIAENKSASAVSKVMVHLLSKIKGIVKTITCDNGKEFAYHEKVDAALESKTYFARLYHSWERGTNENTNGLLRQYFPKGKSLN